MKKGIIKIRTALYDGYIIEFDGKEYVSQSVDDLYELICEHLLELIPEDSHSVKMEYQIETKWIS